MNMLYEKYKNLKIDGSWIGLELGGGICEGEGVHFHL